MSYSHIQYEPCLVSFIDVLGFRSLLDRRPAGEIFELLKHLETFTKPEDEAPPRSMDEVRFRTRALSFTISDAIARVRPYDTQYHDGALFAELLDLLHAQVGLIEHGVIIRAGVAIGDAYVGLRGEGPLFGPALVRAYEIESQEAIYPRIVVDERAIAEHARDERLRGSHNTDEYEQRAIAGFLATGEDGTRYIDYLRASRSEFEFTSDWIQFLGRHATLIRDGLAGQTNHRVRRKFEWLARYHDGCIAEIRAEIDTSNSIANELFEGSDPAPLIPLIEGLIVQQSTT